jgi:hypothetical protein
MNIQLSNSIYNAQQRRFGRHETPRDAALYVMRHQYAWPGGYHLMIITSDGGLICGKCAKDNARQILESTRDDSGDGWQATALFNTCESDGPDVCDNCNADCNPYTDDTPELSGPVKFCAAVDYHCEGLTVSIGCEGPKCEYAEGDADHQCESFFSSLPCDSCGSHLGGDRNKAFGIKQIEPRPTTAPFVELFPMSVCVDCVMYHANGDLPETWS